jgi:hypothetical protein
MRHGPGWLRRLVRPSLPILTVALLATACATSDPSVEESRSAGGSAASTTPSAKFTGKWTRLGTACPALSGDTAKSLKLTGSGTPSAADLDTTVAQNVNCTWGKGAGSVGVSMYINRSDGPLPADQESAKDFNEELDKRVKDGSTLYWKPEPSLADRAYLAIHKDRANIELSVLSSNASITVYYQVAEIDRADWDKALAQHRETMRGLAEDVLDDLA